MDEVLFDFMLFGTPVVVTAWKIIGVFGATMFASRWLVQGYYSRKAGKPVTPRIFWVMSIIGSLMTLSYFVFSAKRDMVGVLQNIFPSTVAVYMLYLDLAHEKKTAMAAAEPKVQAPMPVERHISARLPVSKATMTTAE
jgi:lipid-A-disaccharide synthase-like uncharacterized protein